MFDTFGFVVLNYINFQETIHCVESVIALVGEHHVVVVDNDSPNESFAVLEQRFRNDARVTVVQSGRNGGYSAGNNFGIKVLRARGITDIVIATSDTRVEGVDLLERCAMAKADGVAVVGPYIRGDGPTSQNPLLPRLTLKYILALHLGSTWTRLKSLALRSILKSRNSRDRGEVPREPDRPMDVYMIHGCFLYLSEHYLRHFPLLDEDLFMYGEEDLIAFNCLRRRLRVVYDPLMRVHHGDAKSTSKEGDFRDRTMLVSMATLRKKLSVGKLVHAYATGH